MGTNNEIRSTNNKIMSTNIEKRYKII